jgi:hypothetical protein
MLMTQGPTVDLATRGDYDLWSFTGASASPTFTHAAYDTHPTTGDWSWDVASLFSGHGITYNTDISKWENFRRNAIYSGGAWHYYGAKFITAEAGSTGSYWLNRTAENEYATFTGDSGRLIKRDGVRYWNVNTFATGTYYQELLFDEETNTHDVDFSLSGSAEIGHDVDFVLFLLTHTIDHDVDFLLYDPFAVAPTIDHLVDFHLVSRVETTHDVDFFLSAQVETTHDIDFVLIAITVSTITHDVDFFLTGEILITATMGMTLGVTANESVELPVDATGDEKSRLKWPRVRMIE